MIERAAELVEVKAEKRALFFNFQRMTFLINCDNQQMVRGLMKLFSNGIRASPNGSVVSVKAGKFEQFLRFGVSIPGLEILQELRGEMFEPYQQEAGSLQQSGGLSLAVCKMIIQAHGGILSIADYDSSQSSSEVLSGSLYPVEQYSGLIASFPK